jgi:hypothetical protein
VGRSCVRGRLEERRFDAVDRGAVARLVALRE